MMSIDSVASSSLSNFQRPLEGMRRAQAQVDEAASDIAKGEVTSSRMVSMIEGERMYEANASVVRVQDEMVGYMLDVKR